MSKRILMIIASKNFRDEELLVPKASFEKSGFEVTVASSSLSPSRGMLGATVKPVILVKDARVDDYDAVVFVGGNGASEYWQDKTAHAIAQGFASQGKITAAICIAPVTLANAGLLKGKKATVWPPEVGQLTEQGVLTVPDDVVQDGQFITANGPKAAAHFAETIIRSLK